MSRKLILVVIGLFFLVAAAWAITDPDGVYEPCYQASASEIVDLNANKAEQAPVVKAEEKAPLDDLFSNITTNVNFDVNTNQQENKDINQVDVTAGLSITKGNASLNYTHSRSYSRESGFDPAYENATSRFNGIVNNRVSVCFNFAPEFINNPEPVVSPDLANNAEETPARVKIAALSVK